MKSLAAFLLLFIFSLNITNAQVGVSITVGPPALPVYEQPPCPVDGYLWSPGYWAYGPDGYYWVPGVWVAPPEAGFLWTPGYWGFVDGGYIWYAGYWGPTVGFYGGVCYGFGYGGHGFYGGRWEDGRFRYNTAAWHVNNTVIHNTYVDRTVINNSGNRASFNGRGGVEAQPTASEQAAMKERHTQATSLQRTNEHTASMNKNQLASANGGHPSATARSTVGGQRFSSSGHSISAPHPTSQAHPANNAPQANSAHAAAHPANGNNAPRANNAAPRPQPQNNPAQNRPAPQPQHAAPPQRPSAPAPPPRMNGGGGHPMGSGGGGRGRH